MDNIIKIICPTCQCILSVKYVEGIETKNVTCPKCGVKHKYSEYQPYVAKQQKANSSQYMTDETELGSINTKATIGSLILPGGSEPAKLKVGRNIIGRASSTSTATVQVNDATKTMSRNHYYIDVLVFGNTVRHLLSVVPEAKNGTSLNGVKLESTDKLVLNDGDIIRSGQVEVKFKLS